MLASLVQTLSTGLADILEWIINSFLDALSISDLNTYLSVFPLLSTVYTYLRSFAVALTAIIAGKSLATFALGSIDNGNVKDSPVIVLFKTFAAVALIYWGGYVLEYIIYLGSIPYDAFLGIDAVAWSSGSSDAGFAGYLIDGLSLASGGTLPAASFAFALLELIVLAVIGWNLIKLVVEVCERWLMVGVLLFTSPLAYSTIPSNDTSMVFRRWFSMFIGAVLQMSLSVMFLKLILSGFNGSDTNFMLKMLMILAMCKIAQRVDSYLQQIGIGAPTTGGNMLDDLVAGYHAMRSIAGKKGSGSTGGGSRQSILGGLYSRSNIGAAVSAAASTLRSGSLKDAFHAGRAAYKQNFSRTGVGRASQAWAEAKAKRAEYDRRHSNGGVTAQGGAAGRANKAPAAVVQLGAVRKAAADGQQKGASGSAPTLGLSVQKPGGYNNADHRAMVSETAKDEPMPESPWKAALKGAPAGIAFSLGIGEKQYSPEQLVQEAEQSALANKEASAAMAQLYQSGNAPLSDEQRTEYSKWHSGNHANLGNARMNQSRHGVADEAGHVITYNGAGDAELSAQGVLAGLRTQTRDDGTHAVVGEQAAVAEYMARSVDRSAVNADGSRTYASLPGRADFVAGDTAKQNFHAEAIQSVAAESAGELRTIQNYQSSMPESRAAAKAVKQAQDRVDTLRAADAAPDRIQAAEREFQAAESKLHSATVAAGSAKVREIRERLEELDRCGTPRSSSEYRAAQSDYNSQAERLESYKQAHIDYHNRVAETEEAMREDYRRASAATYDAIAEKAQETERATVAAASVVAKVAALNNPAYHPADCEATRQMACDVFKPLIADMKEGTVFRKVEVTDHADSTNNAGGHSNAGGRSISVEYIKKDGSVGSRTFFNDVASTALPPELQRSLEIGQTSDGSMWGMVGSGVVPGRRTVAPAHGQQVKVGIKVVEFFARLSKKR